MIKINGAIFPEVRTLGEYTLKETRAGHLDVFKSGEYIITFASCDIHTFDSVEELEAELKEHEDEDDDIFGNFGEYMTAQFEQGRQGSFEEYLSCIGK